MRFSNIGNIQKEEKKHFTKNLICLMIRGKLTKLLKLAENAVAASVEPSLLPLIPRSGTINDEKRGSDFLDVFFTTSLLTTKF